MNRTREDKLDIAMRLVYTVWRAMDWDNISPSRRKNIYEELISRIKSASMTKSLSTFYERIARKMGVVAPKYERVVVEILKEGDGEILRILRNETQLVVLLMRMEIEEKKEKYKNEKGDGIDDAF